MPTRMKLTDVDILATLDNPEYRAYKSLFKEKFYAKKEIISMPLNDNNFVFIVKTGRIKVYLSYEDKEFTLSILDKGDIYSSHTRAFTQALEDCEILICDAMEFTKMIAKIPDFGLTIVKVLGDLLKNSISVIDGLVFKDINVRLAEFLIEAAKERGKLTKGGIVIKIGLNTEELAKILGTSRQTISLLLNDLYKTNILERKGIGIIAIKDMEKLKQISL